VHVCVDQNALRSEKLAQFVAETEIEFVLPDAALMEMCKSEHWERTLRHSLQSLAKAPERVHYTMGNGELLSLERALQRPLSRKELIGADSTTFLRELLYEVNEKASSGSRIDQLRLHWAERRLAMAKGHLNDEENSATIRGLITTIRDKLSAKTLRRFRAEGLGDQERISVVSGVVSEILPAIMRDQGVRVRAADRLLKAKSYSARYMWLRVYAVVRWIERGGSESVRSERVTNALVDSYYVITGTYFDHLLTNDGDAAEIDNALRAALAPNFDWNIDVNYLTT